MRDESSVWLTVIIITFALTLFIQSLTIRELNHRMNQMEQIQLSQLEQICK